MYNSAVPNERPTQRPGRGESREVAELKRVREQHPEIASAIDMQIALIDLQRRVQARVPMPWIETDPEWLKRQHEMGRPLLRFKDIPLEWTDVRLMFRQTADILRRFETIEASDHASIQAISRSGNALEPLVIAWYEAAAQRGRPDPAGQADGQPATPVLPVTHRNRSHRSFFPVPQWTNHPRRLSRQRDPRPSAKTESPEILVQLVLSDRQTDVDGADVAGARQHVFHRQ